VTEPIANTEYTKCVYTIMPLLHAIGRYTTKYMQIDLIRLPSCAASIHSWHFSFL